VGLLKPLWTNVFGGFTWQFEIEVNAGHDLGYSKQRRPKRTA